MPNFKVHTQRAFRSFTIGDWRPDDEHDDDVNVRGAHWIRYGKTLALSSFIIQPFSIETTAQQTHQSTPIM